MRVLLTMSYNNIVLNMIPTLYEGYIVSVHRMVVKNRPVDPGSIQGSHRPISFIRIKQNTRKRNLSHPVQLCLTTNQLVGLAGNYLVVACVQLVAHDSEPVVVCRQLVAQDSGRVVACWQLVAHDSGTVVVYRQLVAQDSEPIVVCRQLVAQDSEPRVVRRQLVAQDSGRVVVCWQLVAQDSGTVVVYRQLVAQDSRTVVVCRQLVARGVVSKNSLLPGEMSTRTVSLQFEQFVAREVATFPGSCHQEPGHACTHAHTPPANKHTRTHGGCSTSRRYTSSSCSYTSTSSRQMVASSRHKRQSRWSMMMTQQQEEITRCVSSIQQYLTEEEEDGDDDANLQADDAREHGGTEGHWARVTIERNNFGFPLSFLCVASSP